MLRGVKQDRPHPFAKLGAMTDQEESRRPEESPERAPVQSTEQKEMQAALEDARQRVMRLVKRARQAERVPAELLNLRMRAGNDTRPARS